MKKISPKMLIIAFSIIFIIAIIIFVVSLYRNTDNFEVGNEQIFERFSATETIIIKYHDTNTVKHTITNQNQIKEIKIIISHARRYFGAWTTPSIPKITYVIEMIDSDGSIIDIIELSYDRGYIFFGKNYDVDTEHLAYEINSEHMNALMYIINR